MSSKILVDELAGKTAAGNITVTGEGGTGTMQLQQGLAKFWVNFNASTPATNDSFNQSSLTDNGTGDFTHSYTNSMGNVNYFSVGQAYYNTGGNSALAQWTLKNATGGLALYLLTSSIRVDVVYVDANQNRTNYDYTGVWGSSTGDLA